MKLRVSNWTFFYTKTSYKTYKRQTSQEEKRESKPTGDEKSRSNTGLVNKSSRH